MRGSIPVFRESAMTFSKLARDYVVYLGSYKGASGRTCENYDLAYGQFRGYLQGLGLQDDVKHFNADTVQGFAQYLAAGGNQSNSVNTKLAALGSLARYGMRIKVGRGYALADNPLARVERPTRQRHERKFLYGPELRMLLGAECSPAEHLAIRLFAENGIRVSALVGANVEDFQDANGTFVLLIVPKGRGRQTERVPKPLGQETAEKLIAYLKHREAGAKEPLLVNREGNRYLRTVLSSAVALVARRAGITRFQVRAHALRHTWNVVARVEADLDGPQRGACLDHLDTRSVTKYDHLLPSEAVESFERVRDGLRRYVMDDGPRPLPKGPALCPSCHRYMPPEA